MLAAVGPSPEVRTRISVGITTRTARNTTAAAAARIGRCAREPILRYSGPTRRASSRFHSPTSSRWRSFDHGWVKNFFFERRTVKTS